MTGTIANHKRPCHAGMFRSYKHYNKHVNYKFRNKDSVKADYFMLH